MEVPWAILGLLGFLAAVAGLISILIPLRFVGIKSRGKGLLVAIIGVIVFVVGANNTPPYQPPSSSEPREVARSTPSEPPAPRKPSAAEKAASVMPDAQRKFIAVVEEGRAAFNAGANDMQKGAARPARAKDICSALSSMTVNNWVGQVEELSSNNEGKGVLSIKIAKDIYVNTWNNALSDVNDNTLLDPGSAVFTKASALKEGQWVTFSGTFRREPTDCIREGSMTLHGSLTEPEFIIRFSDINPIGM